MKRVKISENEFDFADNKDIIYILVIYTAGLLIGAMLFKNASDQTREQLKSVFELGNANFKALLLNRAVYYFAVYLLCVALGFSAIGFPLLNLIPCVLGGITGVKIAYYYISFGLKGFGYSSLLIIPQAALFILLTVFLISRCKKLSRGILLNSAKNKDMPQVIPLSAYLKDFGIMLLILALITLFNSFTISAFSPLLKLD